MVVLAGRVLWESSGQGSGMLTDSLWGTGQPPPTKNNLATILMSRNPAREENTAELKLVKEMMRCEKKGIFSPLGCGTQVHQVDLSKGSLSGIQTPGQPLSQMASGILLPTSFFSSTSVSKSLLPLILVVKKHCLRTLCGQHCTGCNQDCSHFSELRIGLLLSQVGVLFMSITGQGF